MRRRVVLGVLASIGIAGCGLREADADLLRHQVTDFPGQIIRGELVGEGPCLGIQTDGRWTVTLWPEAVRLAMRAGDTVIVAGERVVQVGKVAELAGGFVEPGSAYEGELDRSRARGLCPADRYFVVAEIVEPGP